MKMKKAIAFLLIAASVTGMMAGCGDKPKEKKEKPSLSVEESEEGLDYDYGEDKTFHSDEPVVYSMMFSDHENYPYKEDWRLWSAIEEKTNVSFDLTQVSRIDYNDKLSASVSSGSAPYILPKVYDSSSYEDSGQIIAVSDWIQYMPNYQKQVKEWGMEEDLKQIMASDGKYYRLPGMWETVAGGYSLAIRKDVFEKAGVDLSKEADWTWEDFYEALKKVKEYTGTEYVWSDQYQLGCALNLSACVYGVRAGNSADGGDWGLKDGTKFDFENEEFYFADTTEEYRDFLKFWRKMYEEKILDPETLIQDGDQARAKFFRGESYVLTINYQGLADIINTNKMQEEEAELYFLTTPAGPKGKLNVTSGAGRLENGIMISKNALEELGEKDFIKMLRFIDWLWYSDEGHELSQWGVEGETYTKDSSGNIKLNEDIYYNGFNPGGTKLLNADFGFGGGVFAYGGNKEIQFSKFTEEEKEWNQRIAENRESQKLQPPVLADELQKEELNLIKVALMDYVNTSAMEFIAGKKDIYNDEDWEEYVKSCEGKGSQDYIDLVNEIFQDTKDKLGY